MGNCRVVREFPAKGCKVVTWYLVDDTGNRYQAAQGKTDRTVPFQYTSSAPFGTERSEMPFCTNQQQVLQWVQTFAEPGAPLMDPAGVAGPAPARGPRQSCRSHNPVRSEERPATTAQQPHSPAIVPPVSPAALQADRAMHCENNSPSHGNHQTNNHPAEGAKPSL